MKKLLSSPVKMPLSAAENQVYQNALKYITPLGLNLMAVKVTGRPDDFLGWCRELIKLCREGLNIELLDDEQFLPLKKLQDVLETGVAISQFKMARIAPWPIFTGFIEQQSTAHALEERLRLLNYIEDIREQPLANLTLEERLVFAGKHTAQHHYNNYLFDIEWFASTKSAKAFHTIVECSPEKLDAALAHIPLTGAVNFEDYQQFVNAFQCIFTEDESDNSQKNSLNNKAPLPAATRLLAMRRPDQFIALNNNKIDILCKGLSIPKFNNTDFLSYWHDMIGALRTCAWWHQTQPEVTAEAISEGMPVAISANECGDEINQTESASVINELTLWKNRAVLIDLFLYADEDLAQQSNYIRMRDKALNKIVNKPKSKIVRAKPTKESAETIVDKALACKELPEYLSSKRDSILSQVKKGKTVEEAIMLMRAIFG